MLDPFVGTGTTVIAAKRLGRNYIGFDIDVKYIKNAQFKLLRENSNSKVGNIWVSWFLDGLTTIRDKDWEELSQHYFIPEPRNKIDHTAIKLRKGKETCLQCGSSSTINNKTKVEASICF